jgi:release factor glutamine methyltransferase
MGFFFFRRSELSFFHMNDSQFRSWQDWFDLSPDVPRDLLIWWLSDLLDLPLTQLPLYAIPSEAQRDLFQKSRTRLRKGEPVQYVCGRAPFRNLMLEVDSRVLIPRPETEQLVQLAFDTGIPRAATVLDVGTGSGCIALSIKSERPDCRVSARDVSADALDLARANAARLHLDVDFTLASLLDGVPDHSVDILIANLPYIGEQERAELPANVRDFEPELALFADHDGTDLVVKLMHQATKALSPNGILFLETGEQQGAIYRKTANSLAWKLENRRDLAGKERFWIFSKSVVA